MAQQLTLPQEAQDRLTKISQTYKIPMTELIADTQREFSNPFVQDYVVLDTIEKKLNYATKIVAAKYNTRSQLDAYDVIVFGISGTRFKPTKSGEISVIVQVNDKTGDPIISDPLPDENKPDIPSHPAKFTIQFKDKDVERIPQIQTGCMYTVNLGKGKAKSLLYADDRSLFENPIKMDIDMIELLKTVNITRCDIAHAKENLAKEEKTSTGTYSDRLDMRIIRGMIGDYRKGGMPGEEWALYTITDESVSEEQTSPDGEIISKPSLTIFVNPMWLVYERNNIIDFVGTLGLRKGSKAKPLKPPYEISMAGSLLIPVMTPYGEIKS